MKSTYGKSIRWSSFSIVVAFFKQMLLVPLILLAVGKDTYSIWLVLMALVNMVRAINVGQLNYSSNVINMNYAINKDITSQVELAKNANIIMGGIQLIIILILMIPDLLSFLLRESCQTVLDFHLSHSLLFLATSFILYQYCSLFLLRMFEPIGKINITIKYQTIGEFIDFVSTAMFFFMTKSILWTAIGTFISMSIYCVFIIAVVYKNIPFAPKFRDLIDITNGFCNIKKSFILTISFLIEKLNDIGLNLFVTRSYNTQTVPLFNTLKTVTNSTMRISYAMVIPIMPEMQKYYVKKEGYKMQSIIYKYWMVSTIVILITITVLCPFIPKIYTIWTVGKIEYNNILMFYLFLAVIVQSLAMIVVEILKKTNLIRRILFYNVLKVVTVIAILFTGGFLHKVEYIGIALLSGEVLALAFIFVTVEKRVMPPFAIIALQTVAIGLFATAFYLYINAIVSYLLFILATLLTISIYSLFMIKKYYIFRKQ
ncbi:MAG: hypothetical protein LBG80_17750 [Bacteroidales bacterium]|nr:hypothetical protein [Bacteroidales bacterium]